MRDKVPKEASIRSKLGKLTTVSDFLSTETMILFGTKFRRKQVYEENLVAHDSERLSVRDKVEEKNVEINTFEGS